MRPLNAFDTSHLMVGAARRGRQAFSSGDASHRARGAAKCQRAAPSVDGVDLRTQPAAPSGRGRDRPVRPGNWDSGPLRRPRRRGESGVLLEAGWIELGDADVDREGGPAQQMETR